jgi:hypothetical protein
MNANTYYGNQPNNANIYYGAASDAGRGGHNNQDHEAGMGYQYLNNNNPNNYYDQTYNQNNPTNPDNLNYPQTGLTLADTHPQETSTEFTLPPNVKAGMMCCSIFCFFLFFVAMLMK